MKKRLFAFICITLLLVSFVSADTGDDDCGFFCKIGEFVANVWDRVFDTGTDTVESIDGEGTGESVQAVPPTVDVPPEPVAPLEPVVETQPVVEDPPKTVEQIKEEAIEEQIEIVEERAAESFISDINVKDPKCDITLAKDEVKGNENVNVDVVFTDETLKYQRVDISCDQFERYGQGTDKPYSTAVPSSLKIDDTICDWGDVTTKTVYFVIVVDKETDVDLCAAPITVVPKKEDLNKIGLDGCFTDEALTEMKQNCGDLKSFSLPDANGCETVYCAGGEISQCTPEALVEKATLDCEAQGEHFLAFRYSETFPDQEWPCAQIRCSECPTTGELETSRAECTARGDGWSPATETDFETTGCPYIVCHEPESGEELPPE